MKFIKFFLVLSSISVSVFADNITCQIKKNTNVIYSQSFDLPAKSSATLTDVENYRVKVNNYGASHFQIEVFDSEAPARIYTDGLLKEKADAIKWSLWSREILLEVECALQARR